MAGFIYWADRPRYVPEKTIELDGVVYNVPKRPSGPYDEVNTANIPIQYPLPPTRPDLPEKKVTVKWMQGHHLRPNKIGRFIPVPPDPYVKFFYKDFSGSTELRKRTFDPLFFEFDVVLGNVDANDNHILELQYWDKEYQIPNDFGAVANICMGGVICALNGETGKLPVKLHQSDEQRAKNIEVHGELTIEFTLEKRIPSPKKEDRRS